MSFWNHYDDYYDCPACGDMIREGTGEAHQLVCASRPDQRIAELAAQVHDERMAITADANRYLGIITELKRKNSELREALKKYGCHASDCDFAFDDLPCTCGFSKALAGQESK